MEVRSQFEESIKQYNKLLSSQRFSDAAVFAAESAVREFRARIEAAKNVKVVDSRILSVDYVEPQGTADAQVEIEYYSLSTFRVRTLVDTQRWIYITEGGVAQWKLLSPLPEFP